MLPRPSFLFSWPFSHPASLPLGSQPANRDANFRRKGPQAASEGDTSEQGGGTRRREGGSSHLSRLNGNLLLQSQGQRKALARLAKAAGTLAITRKISYIPNQCTGWWFLFPRCGGSSGKGSGATHRSACPAGISSGKLLAWVRVNSSASSASARLGKHSWTPSFPRDLHQQQTRIACPQGPALP